MVVYIIALCYLLNTTTFYLHIFCHTSDSYEPGIPAIHCDTQIRLFTLFYRITHVVVYVFVPAIILRVA